jgi:predicted nucleic acid-binding protein
MILVDAGPLIALIHQDDNQHERCRDAFAQLNEPLGTVWPVVTEALHLLNFSWRAQDALWQMIATSAIEIMPLGIEDVPRIRELMHKYRDLPMDLADGALVRVAERERLRRIFTLDRRDFQVYRPARLGRFAIIPAR